MKIYTKTGDTGMTSLFGGAKVNKSNLRIEAYGTVDELNSYLGLLRDQRIEETHQKFLITIQERLFTIGASLAADPDKDNLVKPDLTTGDVEALENEIDLMDTRLTELKHFILPGGNQASSICHVARCICRRAERIIVKLNDMDSVDPLIIQFMNRLSDHLFTLSRDISNSAGSKEVVWRPRG